MVFKRYTALLKYRSQNIAPKRIDFKQSLHNFRIIVVLQSLLFDMDRYSNVFYDTFRNIMVPKDNNVFIMDCF